MTVFIVKLLIINLFIFLIAMVSLNKVQLIGRLGKDPEFKDLGNGRKIAKFVLATNESFKNANGDWVEDVEWHNITLWNKTAEYADYNLKKGMTIYLEGKNKTNIFEDNEGVKQYKKYVEGNVIKVIADSPNKKEAVVEKESSYNN